MKTFTQKWDYVNGYSIEIVKEEKIQRRTKKEISVWKSNVYKFRTNEIYFNQLEYVDINFSLYSRLAIEYILNQDTYLDIKKQTVFKKITFFKESLEKDFLWSIEKNKISIAKLMNTIFEIAMTKSNYQGEKTMK